MEVKPLRLYDRSRVTADWKCPRARYWAYEHDGKGVVSGNIYLELFIGTSLHDGLAAIAGQTMLGDTPDIDVIAPACARSVRDALIGEGTTDEVDFAFEQTTLVEGLLRGFYKHAWPSLIAQFPKVIAVEKEMIYKHDGLTFMSKPDLILATPEDDYVYIEYKSTSSKKPEWVNSWNTAVQLHSTVKAVEATLGKAPTTVIVQGLYKGYESYGKQSSPFCYAYKRSGNPPFTKDEFTYEYKAGYKRSPTWELEGGVARWIEGMSSSSLAEQFPQSPPIYLKEGLIDSFFAQRANREIGIQQTMEFLLDPGTPEKAKKPYMDAAFPQHFEQCTPGWGKPCQFRQICHGGLEDPLAGGFTYRTPHHTPEIEAWEQQDAQR